MRASSCVLALLCGCADPSPVATRVDTPSVWTSTMCASPRAKVDILLVVDGSASMAQEAAHLSRQTRLIAAAYDRPRSGVDYRIAVVNSQVAQPGCDLEPDAGGRFVDASCRKRLADFVTEPGIEGDAEDVGVQGCLEQCGFDSLATLPTPVEGEPQARPRPWVEATYGIPSLPPDRTVGDDLACRVPVGVAGCAFEAPLEAMRLALARADDPDNPEFGFLRRDAVLFVLFITDEPDCSFGDDVEAISELLDPNGPRTYWSDPDAPTSGMCWNAGVECFEEPDGRWCVSADRPVRGGSAPVLRPVDSYAKVLREIEATKLAAVPRRERAVFVSVLGGVFTAGSLAYPEAIDPEDQARFATGPAVAGTHCRAYPPVRLVELAAEFGEFSPWAGLPVFSVCGDRWGEALACIPGWDPFDPSELRIDTCFADADPTTETLEADCAVDWTDPEGERHALPPCDGDEVPPGELGCAQVKVRDSVLAPAVDPVAGQLTFRLAEGVPRGCVHVTCEVQTRWGTCDTH